MQKTTMLPLALLLLSTLPLRSQEKHDNVWIMGFGSTVNDPA
jgi:hypothetical protein